MNTQTSKFIVSKPSGIHAGSCILGTGESKSKALEDAFGPKPWTPYQKRSANTACVREVSLEEFEQIVYA
jgi:hypothetical protein